MKTSVSILILAHQKSAYTRRCLSALFCSTLPTFQVVLVNNGSTDDTATVLEEFRNRAEREIRPGGGRIDVQIITLSENKGAITGRNTGMEKMNGDYWVFLDNDALVRSRNWLERLRSELATPAVGIVAPKLIYPTAPHKIQCAGCEVTKNGQIVFTGRGQDRNTPALNTPRDCQTLISACWMLPAEVAKKVGSLDERFSPVQFEDIDYCYRIRDLGLKCRYVPDVELYHFENVTTGRTKELNYPYLTVKNGLKFKEKWKHRFSVENGPDDSSWTWEKIPTVTLDEVPENLETI